LIYEIYAVIGGAELQRLCVAEPAGVGHVEFGVAHHAIGHHREVGFRGDGGLIDVVMTFDAGQRRDVLRVIEMSDRRGSRLLDGLVLMAIETGFAWREIVVFGSGAFGGRDVATGALETQAEVIAMGKIGGRRECGREDYRL
jgi:hypothetical protein